MQSQKFRFTRTEKGGIATIAAGLITLLLVRSFGVKEGFWIPYTDGFRVTGWMVVFVGSGWLAFSAAKARTAFFDMTRRISTDKFGISIAAIALAVVMAIFMVIPRLPATKDSALPMDQNARGQVIREERNLRYYISMAFVLTGLTIGAFPAIRFFRK